jgi:hypothetical protein
MTLRWMECLLQQEELVEENPLTTINQIILNRYRF